MNNNFSQFYNFLKNGDVKECQKRWKEEFKNEDLDGILWFEVDIGTVEMIDFLYEKDLLSWRDKTKQCPIHLVCEKEDIMILNRMIKLCVDLNLKGELGQYPIHFSCRNKNIEVLSGLIESGADVNVKSNLWQYPIHLASGNDKVDFVTKLIESGADVNVKNNRGQYPIHLACLNKNLEILKKLIESGADLNVKDEKKQNLISFASTRSSIKVIKILLDAGCEINEEDELNLVVGVDGDFVEFEIMEWSKFDTFDDMRLGVSEKVMRDLTGMDLCGFDGNSNRILDSKSEFHCKFNFCYSFIKKIREFRIRNEIEENIFQCINSLNNEKYFAWRVIRGSCIGEVMKMMKLKHDNIMKIHDIRSYERNPFIITEVIEATAFGKYRGRMKMVSEIKFYFYKILAAVKELMDNAIRIVIEVWICGDWRCLLIPTRYHWLNFYDKRQQLDKFYAAQFISILRREIAIKGIYRYPSPEVDQFVTDLCSYIKHLLDYQHNSNIIDQLIHSKYLKLDRTVTMENAIELADKRQFTVTYFHSSVNVGQLKHTLLRHIDVKWENVLMLIGNQIFHNDDTELDSISSHDIDVKYLDIENFGSMSHFRKIGEGTLGIVGVDETRGLEFAFKLFEYALLNMRDHIRTILKEISILKELQGHANIVKYYQIYHNNYQHLIISMENMKGGSINTYVQSQGKLNDWKIRFYLRQILSGLDYLHSHNILHLDIKCDNILLTEDYQVCKLTDFGISVRLQHGMDYASEGVTSTAHFISPELLSGTPRRYDKKADIWSLGGAIVEMASGQPPFSDYTNIYHIIISICSNKKMEYKKEDVSEETCNLIKWCTQSDPEERPSARELLNYISFSCHDII